MGKPCDLHFDTGLGYLAWHAKADQSHRKGMRQSQCPGCGKWHWPWERGERVDEQSEPRCFVERVATKGGAE